MFIKINVYWVPDSPNNLLQVNDVVDIKVDDFYGVTIHKYNKNIEYVPLKNPLLHPFKMYINTDYIAYFHIDSFKRSCHNDESIHGPLFEPVVVLTLKDGRTFVVEYDSMAELHKGIENGLNEKI